MRASRRAGLGVAIVLVVGATAYVSTTSHDPGCGAGVQAIERPGDPLMTPTLMAQRPEPRRDRLTAALGGSPAPFGAVLAGVDYDYGQWLHLYGIEDGVLAWTKQNAPVTVLDPATMAPRWALRPSTKRTAWDAGGGRFVLLQLSAARQTQVLSYDVATGDQRWCAELGTRNEDGDLLSTSVLGDGSVVVAAQSGKSVSLGRLSGDAGRQVWEQSTSSVDRADFLGLLDANTLVVGGREEFELADPSAAPAAGPVISTFALSDGKPGWSYQPPAGASVHVLGVRGGSLVVAERAPSALRILALDATGQPTWSVSAPVTAYEATMREGVVLLETERALVALDAATGSRLWRWPIPAGRTFFPYGFTLGQMPSLDAEHLLMPTTTDLRVLDLRTGRMQRYPLPTDGINTTYWPYQLLVTDRVIGVLTNTGTVVTRRSS